MSTDGDYFDATCGDRDGSLERISSSTRLNTLGSHSISMCGRSRIGWCFRKVSFVLEREIAMAMPRAR